MVDKPMVIMQHPGAGDVQGRANTPIPKRTNKRSSKLKPEPENYGDLPPGKNQRL
jgi:hypothetical protein